ncbi:hypothetical protein GO497_07380 [Acidovorax citrulli]|nr:hypothetical protein [Paracidovorax citrulli]
MPSLARVEQTSRSLNAFCCVDTEAAMRQARASEARWHRGQALGPLDGVPVSIKDNLGTAGMPTRFGSLAVGEAAAQLPDSPCVERLREAGAVFIGKTTMPDFAHKILTDSPPHRHYPQPVESGVLPLGDPVAERQPPLPQGSGRSPWERTAEAPSASRRRSPASMGSSPASGVCPITRAAPSPCSAMSAR